MSLVLGTGAAPYRRIALTKVNYFKGSNPDTWIKDIPTCNELNFGEVYKGIELRLKASGNNIEKLFLVKPGGNPSDIKLRIEGASNLRVNKEGELEITIADRFLQFSAPVAYAGIERNQENRRGSLSRQ